ncbi:MAG: glutamate-1-semialdehyde 2,1-aminomutase [Anaerorhabdus sp.]
MEDIYKRALKVIPGGVNSPVRSFNSVDLDPVFIKRGKGAYIFDENNNRYIDYISSWGPLILGHSNDVCKEGLCDVINDGITFGLPTKIEVELAEEIINACKSIEMIRMVNSGTEAVMSAIRVARGYSKKDKIIKFEGCYHGHSDNLLVSAGSGLLSSSINSSDGVTKKSIEDTLVSTYNDLNSVKKYFDLYPDNIAAIIVEPVAANMGLIKPNIEFLKGLRSLCTKYNSLLIFDEVITGFRVDYHSACTLFDIDPDIITFGKIIGGGMPVGAYGAKKEIMEIIAPLGKVYQAGTLSGNPLAMKMGLNTLRYLKDNPEVYRYLDEMGARLEKGFNDNLKKLNIKNVCVNRYKSLLTQFFTNDKVDCYDDVKSCDVKLYAEYFKEMLKRNIMLPPSQFECVFLSIMHSEKIIDETIDAHFESMKILKDGWPSL